MQSRREFAKAALSLLALPALAASKVFAIELTVQRRQARDHDRVP